jgi:hypothetical protein
MGRSSVCMFHLCSTTLLTMLHKAQMKFTYFLQIKASHDTGITKRI